MAKSKSAWRLFAMPTDGECVNIAQCCRFNRVTADYTLIYAKKTPGDCAVEIGEGDISRLTDRDKEWLLDCAAALMAERTKKVASGAAKALSSMVDTFAAALEAERGKETEVDDNGR